MEYRREIDGLRAIAVLPVLFYHAGFPLFRGGYVGVDIFLVISGYLITSIIISEQERGAFSLRSFYERRARRILPPLLLVLCVCVPVAWIALSPSDMRLLGKSMVAVTLFTSNLLFWTESGYFDRAAELKPLLHTWSLGIEEQYYLLFPLLLIMLARQKRTAGALVLLGAVAFSFALAQWLSGKAPSAAFFLLPTRAWELGIGSVLAVAAPATARNALSSRLANVASAIGIALIGWAVFTFDESTPHPGLHTLTPTAGAALLIWSASPRTAVGRLLSSRILVGIGLISYSTYLWHQPLFAFSRHLYDEEVTPLVYAALIGASIGMGYASWRLVEAPFRDRVRVQVPALTAACLSGSLLVAIFGASAYLSGGFPARLTKEQREFAAHFENSLPNWQYFDAEGIPKRFRDDCNFYDMDAYRRGRATEVPRENLSRDCYVRDSSAHSVFIWGDSHAQQLRPGLDEILSKDWQVLQVASSGCPPALASDSKPMQYCKRSNEFALSEIAATKPEVVLIAQASGHDARYMKKLAEMLERLGAKQVIFVGPVPHWRRDLPEIVISKLWDHTPKYTSVGLDRTYISLDQDLRSAMEAYPAATYVSAIGHMCTRSGECQTYVGSDRKAGITTWDYGHLTPAASRELARNLLAPLMENSGQQ